MQDTDVSTPDRRLPWPVLERAALAGAALGVVLFAAGSLILYEAQGVLPAAAGVVATFAAALAAGVWAGSPGARSGEPPAWRWVGAGVALAAAGIFGVLWVRLGLEQFGGFARALALLFLLGVPVYALGFLLPALAAWATGAEGDAEAEPPLVPRGAENTLLATLAGAAAGAAASGLLLLPTLSPGLLLIATGAVITFPLFFPRPPAEDGEEERVLHREETPYGTVRVTETTLPGRQPELRLYIDDEVESGELERTGAPTFAYVASAERWLRDTTEDGAAYLFLGGGAHTLPRRIAEVDPKAKITVVERDPAVTRAAYRWFGIRPEHRVRTLHGDARAVAETLPAGAWDRVVVDVYGGAEQVPPHLVTAEGLAALRRLLRPGGVVLLNLIGIASGEGECRFWSVVATVDAAFAGTQLYVHVGRDFPERQNFLVAGAASSGFRFPLSAGRFEAWPVDQWPELPCASVLRDRGPEESETAALREERGGARVPASGD